MTILDHHYTSIIDNYTIGLRLVIIVLLTATDNHSDIITWVLYSFVIVTTPLRMIMS